LARELVVATGYGLWALDTETPTQPALIREEAHMGLIDKVKQQAEQAVGLAQQGVSQGQAKLDQVQAKRQAQTLLRNLGAAYYAQQRQGGPEAAVTAALAAMDEHVAAHPPTGPGASQASSTEEAAPTGQGGDAPGSGALPADGANGADGPGGDA
jgi:hypothetical protein